MLNIIYFSQPFIIIAYGKVNEIMIVFLYKIASYHDFKTVSGEDHSK